MQLINFYQNTFKPVRVSLPFSQTVLILLVSAVISTALALYMQQRNEIVSSSITQTKMKIASLNQASEELRVEISKIQKDTGFKIRQSDLQQEYHAKFKILQMLKNKQLDVSLGYSEALLSLSSLANSQIWLKHIMLSEGSMSLEGQAMGRNAVPDWIEKLQSMPGYKGEYFSSLLMEQNEDNHQLVDFQLKGGMVQENE